MKILLMALLILSQQSFAQGDLEDESAAGADQDVEALYDKEEPAPKPTEPKSADQQKKADVNVQSLSDLAKLAPFSDVAVIQRRFLPKTGRFELSAGAFTNLNNPFFNSVGVNARGAYYFRERYALELLLSASTTSSRQVTDDLENRPGCSNCSDKKITTDNVVTSQGFFGASFKWNPIYGKITWLNKTIVPFDINFDAGLGMTRTTEDNNEPTLHFGTSQVFALSKSMAFRWDLSWNMYQAEVTKNDGSSETLNQNDLFLGLGMSFYFPEATYR